MSGCKAPPRSTLMKPLLIFTCILAVLFFALVAVWAVVEHPLAAGMSGAMSAGFAYLGKKARKWTF